MLKRTRHRIATYALNDAGRLVELAILQRATSADAIALARAEVRRGLAGAVAYTTVLDEDGFEAEVVVLSQCGHTPAGDTSPASTYCAPAGALGFGRREGGA